jgi:hypothetical protein
MHLTSNDPEIEEQQTIVIPQDQPTRPRRRLNRRTLDVPRTMQKFRERISELSTDALSAYLPEGCWLSTYDVWHCYEDDQENIHSNAFEVMRVARGRGLNVRGVVTEHKSQGALVSEPRVAGERVFVGRHNTFNGKTMHRTLSVMPHDKVYLPANADR